MFKTLMFSISETKNILLSIIEHRFVRTRFRTICHLQNLSNVPLKGFRGWPLHVNQHSFFENFVLFSQAIEQTRHGDIKKIKVIRCQSYTPKSTKKDFLELVPWLPDSKASAVAIKPRLLYQKAVKIGFPSKFFWLFFSCKQKGPSHNCTVTENVVWA